MRRRTWIQRKTCRDSVTDEDELPSRIFNSIFKDAHSFSERTPEASRSSSPSVSTHLRHVNRNISLLPSLEPVLQRRLAPVIIVNCTPSLSPSETFPSEPPHSIKPTSFRLFTNTSEQRRYYSPLLPRLLLLLRNHHPTSALQNRTRVELACLRELSFVRLIDIYS